MSSLKLLIPGPVDLEDDVLAALGAQMVPHYGHEWVRSYNELTGGLRTIFGTAGSVYPLTGSGSAGIDAAIGTLLPPGQRVAVVQNGFFGDRMAEIAQANGLEVLPLHFEWGRAAEPDVIRAALRANPPLDALALTYTETSTGVLNPVREIAAVAQEFDLPVIVDAVTALGGVPMQMDAWGIDCCITASQKVLAGPPGLAFVALGLRAAARIAAQPVTGRGWYLNLLTWQHYAEQWGGWHPQPMTMSPSTLAAMHLRVSQILARGIEAYIAMHAAAATRFRAGLPALGLVPLADDATASPLITAVVVEGRSAPAELVAALRERHGLLIAGGLGVLQPRIVRVGHMGKAVSTEYVDAALAALRAELGHVPPRQ